MLQVVEIQGRAQTPRRLRQSEQKVRLLTVTRANPISNIDLCDLCMFNDDMGGRISLQSFSSIPPKLGQAHLQFSNLINLNFPHSLTERLGAAARAENLAFQSLRLLAVVVDVAIFLPLLLVYGSAPPHLFSTDSRCFCAASAVFCRPRTAE